jgi:hypothetical protein
LRGGLLPCIKFFKRDASTSISSVSSAPRFPNDNLAKKTVSISPEAPEDMGASANGINLLTHIPFLRNSLFQLLTYLLVIQSCRKFDERSQET